MRNINLALFSLFLAFLIALPILHMDNIHLYSESPWQLVPFNADSLSRLYKEHYTQLNLDAVTLKLQDSSRRLIMVLVDGWGVPYDETLLEHDFAHFSIGNSTFAVHKRLLQTTLHAENVEYRHNFADGLLLENGDSATCAKSDAALGPHFKQTLCCENCDDMRTTKMIDSLVNDTAWSKIAWTARGTREGDRNKLDNLLKELADIAVKHPDIQFIIQGTHRPLLGTPETRRKYLAPWVPVVFINCELSKSDAKKN